MTDDYLPMMRRPAYSPHEPTVPQEVFLDLACREALYGGAAGGGKSDALLMASLQYVDVPAYAALLLRRTYTDLAKPGAIMDRALSWFRPQGVLWNATEKTFTFPSGARITFGYCGRFEDVYQYQSAEYQYLGVDELTQFEEATYAYLGSRVRRPAEGLGELAKVPLRQRGATNPGGIGHDWVRARFLPWTDEKTGQVIYPCRHTGERRRFVPALLSDNPHLDQAAYIEQLEELDPTTRAQLLHGDWGARPPGEMFDRASFGYLEGFPLGVRWVRAWDLAGTEKRKPGHDPDWTAGVLMGLTRERRLIVWDVQRLRSKPGATKNHIVSTSLADKALCTSAGGSYAVRIEQEPGSAGKYVGEEYGKALLGYDYASVPSSGSKADRALPFAQASNAGLVDLRVAPWLGDYLSELEAFPQECAHDDQVDASSLAFQTLTAAPVAAGIQRPPTPGRTYHAKRPH